MKIFYPEEKLYRIIDVPANIYLFGSYTGWHKTPWDFGIKDPSEILTKNTIVLRMKKTSYYGSTLYFKIIEHPKYIQLNGTMFSSTIKYLKGLELEEI